MHVHPWLPLTVLPAVALLSGFALGPPAGGDYEQVFEALRNMAPREDRAAVVQDLVLRRDVAEFHLIRGTLFLLTPVADRTVGAVFVGEGRFALAPPLPAERRHLDRQLGDSVVNLTLESAVFLFADSTFAELERSLTFDSAPVDRDAEKRLRDALEFLIEPKERYAHRSLMSGLLNADQNGFFAALVTPQRGDRMMFQIDPFDVEEIKLLRRSKLRSGAVEVLSQFQRVEDRRDSVVVTDELVDPLELEACRVASTIANNMKFSAAASVRVVARRPVTWARFSLFSELEVDSVVAMSGTPLRFFRHKDGYDLWIRLEPSLDRGDTTEVRVVYHGDLIEQKSLLREFIRDYERRIGRLLRPDEVPPEAADWWFSIKSPGSWFPRYGSQAAHMEFVFHTPTRYPLASVGRLVDSVVDGDTRTTRWVTEVPTNQASFNLGDFDAFEVTDPRIPPVTVHMNDAAQRSLGALFLSARDPQQQVATDLANSLAFFTNVFGKPLFDRYYATAIPYLHGQAFPGMIHLSWWTFQVPSESGAHEIFRAHEMAHQWWGIGVQPATYRDRWLSEGFAEFAGLWYMQLILGDNDKYFKALRDARQEIRGKRDKAPPVWLGTRALDVDPEYYQMTVYRKGAWVLHMLRNLLIDFSNMNEDAFIAVMQDFYRAYRGRMATTEDFQRVVEDHVGLPMDWFFDQWVRGSDVPTYVLSWTAADGPDGSYLLRIRVRQEDVPETFVMPVPLTIEMEDGTRAVVRVNVQGRQVEGSVAVTQRPVRLELNPFESVLAETKTEGWKN